MWIGCGSQGFWQQISYEKIPSYCKYCKKQGLEEIKCIFKDPSQLKPRQNKVRKEIITKPIYVEKQKGKNQIEVEIVDQETGPIQKKSQISEKLDHQLRAGNTYGVSTVLIKYVYSVGKLCIMSFQLMRI